MVLLWRPDTFGSNAVPSSARLPGPDKDDVKPFFFVLENILTRGVEEKEKPFKLLELLDKDAFHFFYKNFAADEAISKNETDYKKVSDTFMNKLWKASCPQKDFAVALKARMDSCYL